MIWTQVFVGIDDVAQVQIILDNAGRYQCLCVVRPIRVRECRDPKTVLRKEGDVR